MIKVNLFPKNNLQSMRRDRQMDLVLCDSHSTAHSTAQATLLGRTHFFATSTLELRKNFALGRWLH